MTALFLSVTSVAALTGCGDGDDDDTPDASSENIDAAVGTDAAPEADASPIVYAAQIVARECGPTDGPAISIKLSGSVDAKSCTPDFGDPTLIVDVYLSKEIEAPVTFELDGEGLDGAIHICPGNEQACLTEGFTGTVRLDTFEEGKGAAGRVTIRGEDSVIASEDLDATWCEPESGPIICG
jgi:hypothetical protein